MIYAFILWLVFAACWRMVMPEEARGRNWNYAHMTVPGVVLGIYAVAPASLAAPLSFWLWGIAQALLIPNWVAGFSGIVAVAILYFSRIRNEEAMMRQQFGNAYDDYCKRTKRLVPKLF